MCLLQDRDAGGHLPLLTTTAGGVRQDDDNDDDLHSCSSKPISDSHFRVENFRVVENTAAGFLILLSSFINHHLVRKPRCPEMQVKLFLT